VVASCCAIVELRQYTLRSGQRDVLIDLFDREFVESQEAVGMHVIGQFRDLDRPDRFVWLRGFPDMERRCASLTAFYGGPVWKLHAPAARATMLDTDDVLLLRPVTAGSAFAELPARPSIDEHRTASTVVVTVCSLERPVVTRQLEHELLPALEASSPPAVATFVEEPSENTFPALPVRVGEHVVVWLQSVGNGGDPKAVLDASAEIARTILPLTGPPAVLRLQPTARSSLR
jgi:NIPSNAP